MAPLSSKEKMSKLPTDCKYTSTCNFDSPTAISSNTTVRKILGIVKLFSSGFVFSLRWATDDIGLITENKIKTGLGFLSRHLENHSSMFPDNNNRQGIP